MTAQLLVEARRLAAEATTTHEAANNRMSTLRERISGTTARMAEITASRLAGTSNEAAAAEYVVLAGDLDGLQVMLASAEQAVLDTHPGKAQDKLREAEAAHRREQDEIAFDLLRAQSEKLESALLDCIASLYAVGRTLKGPSLVMSWRPSTRLSNAIHPGVI